MITVIANQKGGVGKTTSAANIGALFATRGRRVLVVDIDPQCALTRQLGLEARSLGVNLLDVMVGRAPLTHLRERFQLRLLSEMRHFAGSTPTPWAFAAPDHRITESNLTGESSRLCVRGGRASAAEAVVPGVHGMDVIPGAGELAGVEMSLVGELGRERFLHDALHPVIGDYEDVVIDAPPNLGLLTVNALVCADRVLAPVSAEDEGAVHGLLELRVTLSKLAKRLGGEPPPLIPMITRWSPARISSRTVEDRLVQAGLAPMARIRLRSALVAEAAAAGVPVARLSPDSTVATAYGGLVEHLTAVLTR